MLHQTIGLKLTVFIAVRAEPVTGVIMSFVNITDGDAVSANCPQLFELIIIELFFPLTDKESFGFFTIIRQFGTVTSLSMR